jgi:predicted phosphoadenosine phosphosulfate sulfurtransferase
VVVSFSGGKDSTAVLHVALDVAAELGAGPVSVYFLDEECITYETEAYVRRVVADHPTQIDLSWWALPVTHRNACSATYPWWYPWAPEAEADWVRPLPVEALTLDTLADRYGYLDPGPHDPAAPPDAVTRPTWPALATYLGERLPGRTAYLMGIRASESFIRQQAVANSRPEPYVVATSSRKVDKVYSIYDWTTSDVWTAPRLRGWDHNTSYDLMEMAGVPLFDQRCAPPFGDEPSRNLYMWSTAFPDVWEKMCRRVPGSATGARYSRTVLYAAGALPTKPSGLPWPEFIRETIIENHADENTRRLVAQQVRSLVNRHYARTSDPILSVPHPVSGVAWPFVLKMAVRGDLKGRMGASNSARQSPEILRTYRDALARYRSGDPDA